jgi:hypothetical protein
LNARRIASTMCSGLATGSTDLVTDAYVRVELNSGNVCAVSSG